MERMKDFKAEVDRLVGEYIVELEEENKNLKEEVKSRKEYQQRSQSADGEQIERLLGEKIKLEEENKKLKDKIDELEKCNLNLQERLDRKEELNKGYRKEIKEHKLYEEKLEHRIVEFEELLHGE